MSGESSGHGAPPPRPRRPNNVDQLEIPLARRSGKRRDTLPEDTLYMDRGCGEECTSSLDCPYPHCRYDETPTTRRERLIPRDRAIAAARLEEGLSVAAIAARFNVGRRTVFRALESARRDTEQADAERRRAEP